MGVKEIVSSEENIVNEDNELIPEPLALEPEITENSESSSSQSEEHFKSENSEQDKKEAEPKPKEESEKKQDAKTEETKAASVASTFQSYIDDVQKAVKSIFEEMDFSKATLDSKREAAKRLSQIAATACTAIALQPIPIADVLLLTPIQILMVQGIGRIYGVPLTTKTAYEVGTNIGLGVLLRQIFITIVKTGIPLMGGVLMSTYVYFATYYMGKVAQVYFEKGRPLTQEEMNNLNSAKSRAEERLKELNQLRKSEMITESEYQQKRQQIIDEI